MLFLSFKLFIFILVLNIILGSNKNNNVVNIFEKIKNHKNFHIRINKSLAEYIKKESTNNESTELDSLYEELFKNKLKKHKKLMDIRKKEKNYEEKKITDKKWQDKVVKSKIKAYYVLIGDYNKYYEMQDSFNLIEIKNKIKNKLYEIIFKGTSFWKGLGNFLQLLGICAVENMFVAIFSSLELLLEGANCTCSIVPCWAVPAGIYGGFILLIIITVIVVVLLVVWLWPKDDKNIINKILGSKKINT